MSKYRVLFAGSGDFAVPILEKLLVSSFFEVVGVITQPHKPVGRQQKLTPAKLESWLMQSGWLDKVRLFHPQKLRIDAEEILAQTAPDVLIVASYGQMVPDIMLTRPKHGALNFHGSLLPKLRGAVPVPMAILQGLSHTGVTLQKMVHELDAGAIVVQKAIQIRLEDTTATLMIKLGDLAANMLESDLIAYLEGRVKLVEQDHTLATFCYEKDLDKAVAQIKPSTTKIEIDRMVRAYNPWPVAWGHFKIQDTVKRIKIFAISNVTESINTDKTSGTVRTHSSEDIKITRRNKQLFLNLVDGEVELLELQLEGKKQAKATEYLYLAEAQLFV